MSNAQSRQPDDTAGRAAQARVTSHATTRGAIRLGGGFLVTALLALHAGQASAQQLTTAALEQWLAGYERAWETRDAAGAAELFTPNASYHEMPFDAPKAGQAGIREYWSSVTADQRDIDFKSQVISVAGQTGVAHWSATFTAASTGTRVELDGVFVLTFDAGGRCSELREWWHLRP
jgi:ketosteroid isomerase-like protein